MISSRAFVLTLFLLLTATLCSAQITLQMDDLSIQPVTVATRGYGANFNTMTAPGANQSWDFSASITVFSMTETWDNPAGHYGAEEFPDANLVMCGDFVADHQQLTYFIRTANSYTAIGSAFYVSGEIFTSHADVEGSIISCPVNFGDEWDCVRFSEYQGTTSHDSTHYTVDAWGTIADLNGSFNCLRVRANRTVNEYPSREVETTIGYSWFAPDWGEVVTIQSDPDELNPEFDDGTFQRIVSYDLDTLEPEPDVAREFALLPAYPNPFNTKTTLHFTMPAPGPLSVVVFNALGREVARLADRRFDPGMHTLSFDARHLASGVYFVRATLPGSPALTQHITLLK